MSLDKALDELMDGDIIVFQKYVLSFSSVCIANDLWSGPGLASIFTVLGTAVECPRHGQLVFWAIPKQLVLETASVDLI